MSMYKRIIGIFISTILCAGSSAQKFTPYEYLLKFDFDELNKRAAAEYLVPVRPGDGKKFPFWNGCAPSFIYAPVFEFAPVKKAAYYVFSKMIPLHLNLIRCCHLCLKCGIKFR